MIEGLIAFGGSLFGNVFGLFGGKIDNQTSEDVNNYNRGQAELATKRTKDLVTAAVAAAVAIAIAVLIVRKKKKR